MFFSSFYSLYLLASFQPSLSPVSNKGIYSLLPAHAIESDEMSLNQPFPPSLVSHHPSISSISRASDGSSSSTPPTHVHHQSAPSVDLVVSPKRSKRSISLVRNVEQRILHSAHSKHSDPCLDTFGTVSASPISPSVLSANMESKQVFKKSFPLNIFLIFFV
jgi:hypothetical protein